MPVENTMLVVNAVQEVHPKFCADFAIELVEPLIQTTSLKQDDAVDPEHLVISTRLTSHVVRGEVRTFPTLSANSIRGRLRTLLAEHFRNALGIEDYKTFFPISDTNGQYCIFTLMRGGRRPGGVEVRNEQLDIARTVRETIPYLSLLGCWTSALSIEGKLTVNRIFPMTQELQHLVKWHDAVPGEQLPLPSLSSISPHRKNGAVDLGEAYSQMPERGLFVKGENKRGETKNALGIQPYTYLAIPGGVWLVGDVEAKGLTEIETSCIAVGLRLLAMEAHFGARTHAGYGGCRITTRPALNDLESSERYEGYLRENKARILDYLRGDFIVKVHSVTLKANGNAPKATAQDAATHTVGRTTARRSGRSRRPTR